MENKSHMALIHQISNQYEEYFLVLPGDKLDTIFIPLPYSGHLKITSVAR